MLRPKLKKTKPPKSSVTDEFNFKPIGDLPKHLSVVLYGRSGTGKTTLASTFPKPMLYLDIKDDGAASIQDVDGIDAETVTEVERLERIHEHLSKNPKLYKSVVIDTISMLQQLVVEEHLETKNSRKKAGEWGAMSMQDWGVVASRMKELLIDFRDLTRKGMSVVFIAQDRVFNFNEDEGTGDDTLAPEVGPGVSPGIAKVLNAAVSVIGNTFIRIRKLKTVVDGKKKEKDKIEYCLRLGPNPVYVTKVRKARSVQAPSVVADPTYEDILDVINGEE